MHRIILALVALALALLPASCSTVSDLPRLDTMDEPEFAFYVESASTQAAAIAEVGLGAGTFSIEGVLAVAAAMDALSHGTTAVALGELTGALDLGGWENLAITLGTVELDAALHKRGAYVDGVLGPRGREVLEAVASKLRAVATLALASEAGGPEP